MFPRWKYSQYFENQLPQSDTIPITKRLNEGSNLNYQDIVINDDNQIIDLAGYWQSHKYFEHCKNEIKNFFKFKRDIYNRVALPEANSCSVHIRRGDYVNLDKYHPMPTMDYYNKAIQMVETYYGDDVNFYIFSDDIEWCKQNFVDDKFTFIEGFNEIEDLCRMTTTEYHIIANSSFSWWGAYLADSEFVVSPEKWFGEMYEGMDKDRIPNDWMRI